MNKHTLPFLILLSALCAGCISDNKPKVDYNQRSEKREVLRDISKVVINDLPIEIDSTDYVIYVTGEPVESYYGSSYGGFGSSSDNSNNFSVVSAYKSDVSGKIYNLKFQKKESDTLTVLTDKHILIHKVTFLRPIFNQNKKQYLIYSVYDSDTNGDQKLSFQDLETLYLSRIDGKNFRKITPDFQEIIDYKVIKIQNRLYFRTIEDIDKDGRFDNEDKIHYFYIDFDSSDLTPKEYNR